MGAPCDEMHIGARLLQPRAEKAPHTSRSNDRYPHDVSVYRLAHGYCPYLTRTGTRRGNSQETRRMVTAAARTTASHIPKRHNWRLSGTCREKSASSPSTTTRCSEASARTFTTPRPSWLH